MQAQGIYGDYAKCPELRCVQPADGFSMKTFRSIPFAAACLAALLQVGSGAHAETDPAAGVSDSDLKATGERMRQTVQQLQKDIQQRLERLRSERATLQSKQAAERKRETERAAQQDEKDRAALAAVKAARQREELAAAQEKARREAAARAAEAERRLQSELKAKEDEEAALERAQQESLDAYKAGTRKNKLGTQTQFGVDL
jgi:chromosome segregation ATPase